LLKKEIEMDVRRLRKAARMTKWELAERTRISRMRLSFAECGYLSLTPAELSAVERATVSGAQERLLELSRLKTRGAAANTQGAEAAQ
jgi:transcriptional regulator with XRE-family HTH domain